MKDITPTETNAVIAGSSMDKINNIVQKETRMARVGVTREKYLRVIAESLEAMKVGDVVDSQGNVKRELIPDHTRRQWAAEKAALLFGDMIERKEIEHDIGDKTLEKFKGMSVDDLKKKARDILAGKPVIDVTPAVNRLEND